MMYGLIKLYFVYVLKTEFTEGSYRRETNRLIYNKD